MPPVAPPPAFAPTRRAVRPTPGEPIEVAIVPGQTVPVRQMPPSFAPASFVPKNFAAAPLTAPENSLTFPPPGIGEAPPEYLSGRLPSEFRAAAGADSRVGHYAPSGQQAPSGYHAPSGKQKRRNRAGKRKRHPLRIIAISLVLLLIAVLAWPLHLLWQLNGQIQTVEALSGRANTPGTTFLLAGTDARSADDEFGIDDGVDGGGRSDSILILHRPRNGTTSMISLPRDTFVEIPGRGPQKLNAAYAFGGPKLLVETVEELTGLTIDHFVEISMGGLGTLVNVVGGVNLCWDKDVNDENSGLIWTAGCHSVDGPIALAFARMRYSDPMSDIGRGDRQRQVINAIMQRVVDRQWLSQPTFARHIIDTGLSVLTVDEGSNILSFIKMALTFHDSSGPQGFTGAPPISDMDYRPGEIGSTVRLDPEATPIFWQDLMNGNLEPNN